MFIMGFLRVPFIVVLVLLLSAGAVSAHSPQFADGNTSPETAMEIEDTVKSWAFYSHLHQGERCISRSISRKARGCCLT